MTSGVKTDNFQFCADGQCRDRNLLLGNFPKQRQSLPVEYQRIYERHYKENRRGYTTASRLARFMESWMHKQVGADNDGSCQPGSTLEIGAGTLNHLVYEPTAYPYDVVEPFAQLIQSGPEITRIRNIYNDIFEIPDDRKYDRIISIATLEHVCDLPKLIAKSALLLHPGGQLRAGIPSEGTWLWKLGWRLSTGLEFRIRYGLNYELIMKHEHVNTAAEIDSVLRYFFDKVQSKVFGLSKSVSLYQFFCCEKPDLKRCTDYLRITND
jgi:Methyltransferase domain